MRPCQCSVGWFSIREGPSVAILVPLPTDRVMCSETAKNEHKHNLNLNRDSQSVSSRPPRAHSTELLKYRTILTDRNRRKTNPEWSGTDRPIPIPKSETPQPSQGHRPNPRLAFSPAHTDTYSRSSSTSEVNSATAVHTYTVAARAPLQRNVLRDGWPRRQAAPPPPP
jgi:hypothetical protein